MTSAPPILVAFTRDLRLSDHPALTAAAGTGAPVVPVYVDDATSPGQWALGGAARWWLHCSLTALAGDFETLGARLILRRGALPETLAVLVRETGARAVYMTRRPEPWQASAVARTQEMLGVPLTLFDGASLYTPGTIRTGAGTAYKVFSQFWRACRKRPAPEAPLAAPDSLRPPERWPESAALADFELPAGNAPIASPADPWRPGERGARERFDAFRERGLAGYRAGRDRPADAATSRLSPHLAFGEISPRQVWHGALAAVGAGEPEGTAAEAFLREIGWREFAYHVLDGFPELPEAPLNPRFAAFPWRDDPDGLAAWQAGRTGYPIVDAGMRELAATGWMHNRLRMITGSFLVKDLRVHWLAGERWFWERLVDADLANNALGWQWVAGSGPDAAPYFRIFNPVRQGERFDPEGAYVRRWIPELAGLANSEIHAPWTASRAALDAAGVALGKNYPRPILDHQAARKAALEAFEAVKRR